MSYILDALRRADADRERGQVPGVHAQPTRIAPTPPAVAVPTARRWLPVALALPVVLLLAWLTWRVVGSDVGSQAPSPVAVATQPAFAPTVPAPVLGAPPASSVPEATTGGSPVPADSSGQSIARIAPAPAPAKKPVPAPAPSGVKSSSSRSTLPASAGIAPPNVATAPAKLYAVDELPEDIRRDLPKLSIGGSTYSESSASRFVIVNGQLFHEGDTLAPGLVLQQIKTKSAVLAFRGYRYAITL